MSNKGEMMKIIGTTVYKCEHCGKMYQMKFYCIKHEKKCKKNPANKRPCFDCECLEMKTIEYGEYDPNNGDHPSKGSALFCNYKKHFVYPPHTPNPYNEDDLGCENEPMPLTCTENED